MLKVTLPVKCNDRWSSRWTPLTPLNILTHCKQDSFPSNVGGGQAVFQSGVLGRRFRAGISNLRSSIPLHLGRYLIVGGGGILGWRIVSHES